MNYFIKSIFIVGLMVSFTGCTSGSDRNVNAASQNALRAALKDAKAMAALVRTYQETAKKLSDEEAEAFLKAKAEEYPEFLPAVKASLDYLDPEKRARVEAFIAAIEGGGRGVAGGNSGFSGPSTKGGLGDLLDGITGIIDVIIEVIDDIINPGCKREYTFGNDKCGWITICIDGPISPCNGLDKLEQCMKDNGGKCTRCGTPVHAAAPEWYEVLNGNICGDLGPSVQCEGAGGPIDVPTGTCI